MFKTILTASFVLAAIAASSSAIAAIQTVTLDVPGMTCSSCPITVKKALMKVEGVQQVKTNFDKKEAVVTFDNVKTSTAQLRNASGNAGYPVSVKIAQ
ncbi:mercury resistance system periplasmic binding protein MerP [Glaciimonas immobilis]|uniref:Periplasmic mercury ion-binding protein n=1 Tax=Glaciimonas immobilis TaxID=728004 RepID=A0A840RQQ8_9BURK|nr:mercury resistance system periplasmic binding protein MerP [Glaciimonas immobilis]KAF3999437.1 mercury resistance system periplasmic binding protein MerP [Glaciimonas immobilis]MBB5198941.1 mercuric ion binding protein [Glaciimonas immobilis]